MFRYNDGTIRQNPPVRVEFGGFVRNFHELTREQWDSIGFNEAVPLRRDPFTAYETEWRKGDDLVYREEVVSAVAHEAARIEHEAARIRAERDRLLRASDWTQMGDCPLVDGEKAAWAEYRQALRGVPQQAGFPGGVRWPAGPESQAR